uniref:Putative member of chemokine-like factor super family n=1 Tax=Nyssomyia neivai TaxID=330878 RepID=A0A1L8E2T8_9DIPT
MADPGFPAQHTTATMTTTETHVSPQIRYDPSYLRTVPGIIKLVCIVLNLIGFICIEVSAFSYHSRGSFFNSVAMTGFWFTGIMLLLYLFHVLEKFYKLPWLHIELVFCAIWTLLYALAAGLAAAMGLEAYTAAAFFGFCAMVAYGYDAFLKYKAVQSGQIAQGTRQQTTVQQTVTA